MRFLIIFDIWYLLFEPVDPSASQTEFRFEANKGFTEDSEFVFNVGINGEGGVGQESDNEDEDDNDEDENDEDELRSKLFE